MGPSAVAAARTRACGTRCLSAPPDAGWAGRGPTVSRPRGMRARRAAPGLGRGGQGACQNRRGPGRAGASAGPRAVRLATKLCRAAHDLGSLAGGGLGSLDAKRARPSRAAPPSGSKRISGLLGPELVEVVDQLDTEHELVVRQALVASDVVAAVLEELVLLAVVLVDPVVATLAADHQLVREQVVDGQRDAVGLDPGGAAEARGGAGRRRAEVAAAAREPEELPHVLRVLAAQRDARAIGDPVAAR